MFDNPYTRSFTGPRNMNDGPATGRWGGDQRQDPGGMGASHGILARIAGQGSGYDSSGINPGGMYTGGNPGGTPINGEMPITQVQQPNQPGMHTGGAYPAANYQPMQYPQTGYPSMQFGNGGLYNLARRYSAY